MIFLNVALIRCYVELTPNLRSRAFCGSEKVNKFRRTTSIVALCYVRHHRDRCPTNLILQSKVTREGRLVCNFVNTTSQLSCLFPAFNLFKFLKCSHCILLEAEGVERLFPNLKL